MAFQVLSSLRIQGAIFELHSYLYSKVIFELYSHLYSTVIFELHSHLYSTVILHNKVNKVFQFLQILQCNWFLILLKMTLFYCFSVFKTSQIWSENALHIE